MHDVVMMMGVMAMVLVMTDRRRGRGQHDGERTDRGEHERGGGEELGTFHEGSRMVDAAIRRPFTTRLPPSRWTVRPRKVTSR